MRIQYRLARLTGFPLPSLRAAMALAALLLLTVSPPAAGENWQAWRGPRGDGTSNENDLPVTWNGKTGTNIAWKISPTIRINEGLISGIAEVENS